MLSPRQTKTAEAHILQWTEQLKCSRSVELTEWWMKQRYCVAGCHFSWIAVCTLCRSSVGRDKHTRYGGGQGICRCNPRQVPWQAACIQLLSIFQLEEEAQRLSDCILPGAPRPFFLLSLFAHFKSFACRGAQYNGLWTTCQSWTTFTAPPAFNIWWAVTYSGGQYHTLLPTQVAYTHGMRPQTTQGSPETVVVARYFSCITGDLQA